MRVSPGVSPEAGWLDVIRTISKQALGAVNVVDEDQKLLGLVTDGDLRRTIERTPADKLGDLNASEMMTRNPVTATAKMLAYEALQLMENRPSQITVLPVIDLNGVCVGLLRLHDVDKSGV
jgi:arabinose-5-phosphate isomerase